MQITVSTDRDNDLPVSPGGQNLTRRASKFTTSKVKRENYGPRVNFYEDMDLLNFLRRDSIAKQGETKIYEGLSMVKLQSNQHIQELPLNNPKEKEKEDKNMPLSVVNVVIGQEVELSDKEKKYTVNDKPSKDLDSNSKGHKRLSVSSLSKNKVEQLEKDNHNTFDSSGLDPKDISERTPNNQELLEPSKSRFNSMHTTIKRGETRKRSNIFEEGAEIKGRKRRFIDAILRSWTWTLLITILTFYTLFSDDVKVIFFNPTHGLYFDIANYICMAFFVLEIVLQAISDTKNYLFSFYFFLDVISTLTMILDLQYFSESTSGSGIDSLNNIFRSAKTAKLGSRAGRIGRVIRIVGVFRLSKIFKEAEKVKQKKIDKFDKELKKKRQEKEEELRKIKEHLNEIENLKKIVRGPRFSIPLLNNSILASDKMIPQNTDTASPTAGSKFKSSLAHALQKKDFPKHVNLPDKTTGTIPENQLLEPNAGGASTVKGTSAPSTGEAARNSFSSGHAHGIPSAPGEKRGSAPTVNMSLLKALNKFKVQGNQIKKRLASQDVENQIRSMASTRQKTITSNSMPRQTVVGKVIIEKNTKILILLVLIMMIAMIFFNSKVYTQDPDVCVDDIEIFKYLLEADDPDTIDSNIDSLINKVLNEKYESHDIQLVEYNLLEYGKKFRTENYWSTMTVNCTQQVIRSEKSYDIFIAFITRKMTVYESMLNILKMICLIGVLFLGSYLFTKDANRMILAPIENIMCLVNLIAKNPDISYELMEMDQEAKRAKYDEMKLIERAILKLGALLMFVFGRAGNNVIYSNISNIRSENIDVETVGTSSFAIFGFCDIRNFTDMTEILEEGIMPFVNTVAKVVHSSVIKFMGSANKNIGDAFLLVWNLPEECFNAVQEDPQAEAQSSNIFLERYAESAIASFVEIIINLAGSTEVQNFAKLPKVQSKLPNFKVKMGFGMHMGWAIEGAIGSEWKIDASYLSPNVNISSRLEAATKHYGVPLLISHPVYNCLSNRTKAYCRQIDRVTLKGSEEPIGLYTIDIDAENVVRRPSLGSAPALTLGSKLGVKDMENLSPHELKNLYLQEDFYFNIETLVPKVKQHSLRDDNFDGAFRKAIKSYLDGKWNQAYEQLQNCLLLRPNDGPTQNILEYIKSYGKNSPPQWNGVRNLTEK